MTTKPQTKSNAQRSAEAATRRTGIEHTILESEGGWVVVASGPQDRETVTSPQTLEDFTQEVIRFLETEGCLPAVTEEGEARTMIEDGHANGRAAARVAGDILAWLAEAEDVAEEAAEAMETATLAPAAPGDATGEAGVDGTPANTDDAPETPPAAPTRATPRQAAQAVLDAWNDEANRETGLVAALEGPMSLLRAALAGRAPRSGSAGTGVTREPRAGT